MASVITDIQYQKRNRNRVSVFIDGEYSFSVSLLAASQLHIGQVLQNEEIDHLKDEYNKHMAYHQSIRFLSIRQRSSYEVHRYLKEKGYSLEICEKTVSLLEEKKYIDDMAFAVFFVENRERFGPKSKFALTVELRQKGINNEIIDTVLREIDETKSAWNAIEKKIFRWKPLPEEKFKLKVMGLLARRGFNYEVSHRTAEKALHVLMSENIERPFK